MPELPEIETLRIGLKKYLVGHKILDVDVKVSKLFQGEPRNVIGAKVLDIKRIGKGIIIDLNNNYSMAVHLKLTGQLVYRGVETKKVKLSEKTGGSLPSNFTHVIFKLDKGATLYYNDLRKFGWIKVLKKDEVLDLPFFKEMGPEPAVAKTMAGKPLTFKGFKQIVQIGKLPIKVLLMDQKRIGGIGNIYANDALFKAGIDPRRKGNTLDDKEIKRLFDSLIFVLKMGLKYGGSSDVNYVNATGEEGSYQDHALVYDKKGKKCPCGGTIEKFFLGGRGTYFCPTCQH
ncbi:MAG: DNA-formamidopyrimidine glycosylase [Candidatus Levybacteria bacterium RBG_16_35_6]|nr:MAG: DNA-formamidopyrimidine glycosylase [Candidatus Levybacteria bacterium RBG_16_35_6]